MEGEMETLTLENCSKVKDLPYCILLFTPVWSDPGNKIKEYLDTFNLPCYWVDTDEQVKLCKRYRVTKVPTLSFMKKGVKYNRIEGRIEQEQLQGLVDDFIKRSGNSPLRDILANVKHIEYASEEVNTRC